jgi:lipopolysaccharide assembly outer membrane protein LptD (OstA)
MPRRLLQIAVAVAAVCALCPAQSAQQSSAEKQPPQVHDIILEHADKYRYDEKTNSVELSGEVILRHEDGTLHCDRIAFNTKTKQGEATGSPTFVDPRHTVSGESLFIDFKARVAGFRRGVKVVRWPKKEQTGASSASAPPARSQEERKEGEKRLQEYEKEKAVITADEVQYFYREKRVVARGNVKAEQEKRTAWADQAIYTDSDELLVISGNVRLETAERESFRCNKATISLRDNWVEAEGAITSHFRISEEE